jgi:hypothetical protein
VDIVERSGQLSPRNTDTVRYRVTAELPDPRLPKPGETFSAWPQGIHFASVSGLGLGVVTNGDLADWEKAGKIERIVALPAARAAKAKTPAAATSESERASQPAPAEVTP